MTNSNMHCTLPLLTLFHPEFYGHPIEIEPVEDDHLLGVHINPTARAIAF